MYIPHILVNTSFDLGQMFNIDNKKYGDYFMKKYPLMLLSILLICIVFVACDAKSDNNANQTDGNNNANTEIKITSITLSFPVETETFVAGKNYRINVETLPAQPNIALSYSFSSGNDYASISNNTLCIFENAKNGEYVKFSAKYKDVESNELFVKIVNYDEQISKLETQIAALKSENSSLQSKFRSLETQLSQAMTTYDNYIRKYCSNGRDWDPGTPTYVKQQAMRLSDNIDTISREMSAVDTQIKANKSNIASLQKQVENIKKLKDAA